jgi:3-dehydroquinate synthase
MIIDDYSNINQIIADNSYSSVFLLLDNNTDIHCLDLFIKKSGITDFNKVVVKDGEKSKSIDTCEYVWDYLNSNNGDRKSLLINIGGGVVTDLGGFIASTYLRGVDFINVPTTVLCMVDAAFGGKTGINFKSIKNQIGVINKPKGVLIDIDYLKTLNKEEYINGFAEIYKHSLITDNEELQFENLVKFDFKKDIRDIIHSYSSIKKKVVELDLYESNYRKILNLGHTIGHAVESYSIISKDMNDLKHGEAIAVGLITELYISHKIHQFDYNELLSIKEELLRHFNRNIYTASDQKEILKIMRYDKKNYDNKVKYVLLKGIGSPIIDQDVEDELFFKSFEFYND